MEYSISYLGVVGQNFNKNMFSSVPEDFILFKQTTQTLMTCPFSRVSPGSSQFAKVPTVKSRLFEVPGTAESFRIIGSSNDRKR